MDGFDAGPSISSEPSGMTGTSKADIDTSRSNVSASTPLQSQIATLKSQALQFLSTASDKKLLTILAALAIATFVFLGRLGLLLIGLVTGVILHAYWEGGSDGSKNGSDSSYTRRKRELAIEVAKRLLEWPSQNTTTDGSSAVDQPSLGLSLQPVGKSELIDPAELAFSSFRPATAAALTALTDAVVRDYVTYWYKPILPTEESFPFSCQKTLVDFITSFSSHFTHKRPADTFLQFVTNSSSMIIVFLNELSLALQTAGSDSSAPAEAVKQYLAQFPDSSLANVLANEQQQKKLKMVADDILSKFLDHSAYECEVVRIFLRETFAGLILESTIKNCSHPDFINSWIVNLLQEGEPEIMNAIDAGLEHARKDEVVIDPPSGNVPFELHNLEDLPTQVELMHNREVMSSTEILQKVPDATSMGENTPIGSSVSSTTTEGMMTPTSSESERIGESIEDGNADLQYHQTRNPVSLNGNQQTFTEVRDMTHDQSSHMPQTPPSTQSTSQTSESVPTLTLCGALVLIDDGSDPGGVVIIRSRPVSEYSLQIEPASPRQPGWMIFRKYADFEYLHEGLANVSKINAIHSFLDIHATLPTWKGQTKKTLIRSLEAYLQDALRHERLAETEHMKKFLGKDRGLNLTTSPYSSKASFSFPRQRTFENMGKGVLEVLSNAPKGVAGGGKAVLEGVTGVFGGASSTKRVHDVTAGQAKGTQSKTSSTRSSIVIDHRQSEDYIGPAHSASLNSNSTGKKSEKAHERPYAGEGGTFHGVSSAIFPAHFNFRTDSASNACQGTASTTNENGMLDSGPHCYPDSTASPSDRSIALLSTGEHVQAQFAHVHPGPSDQTTRLTSSKAAPRESKGNPITEDETRVAVELIFAVINELYTLSSAWNIRKTLLNAAKSYILRPGNPNLESIRTLLQESMIDAQTSDKALATHLTNLRENSLPTQEEMSMWSPPLSSDESEKLKANARKLLIQRGMPQALMSVMGAAATGEALGRVFDCLQVEEVGRGFMFALILQALKAVIL